MGERSSGGFVNVFNRLNSSRVEPKQSSTAIPEMAPRAKTTTSNGRTSNKLSLLNKNNQSKGTRVTVRTSRSKRKSDESRTKPTNKLSSKNREKSRSLPSALLNKNRNKYENGDGGDGDGDEDQPEHDSQNLLGIDHLLKLNDSTSWMDSFVVSEASLSLNDSGSSLNFSSNLLDASNPDMEDYTTEVGNSASNNNKTKPIKHPPVSVPRKKNRSKSPKSSPRSSPRSSPKQQQTTKVSKHQPLSSVIPPTLEAASSDTILSSTRSARAKYVRSNSASNLESSPTSRSSPATTNTRVKKHRPLSGSEKHPAVDASRGRKGNEDISPPRRRSRSAGVIRTQKKVASNSGRRKASSPHPIDQDYTKARNSYQSLDTSNTSKSSTSSRSGKKKSYKKEKDSNSKRSGRLTDLLKRSNSAGNLQTQPRKKISSGKLQEKEKVLSKRSSRMADLLKRSNSAQHLLEELETPPKPSSSSDLPPLSPSALKRSSSAGNLQEKTSTKTSTKRSVRPGKVKRSNSADYFPGDEPGDRQQQQQPERSRTPRRSARDLLRRSNSAQHLPEDLGGEEKVKMSRRTARALKRSNSAGNLNEQKQDVAQGKENGSSTPSAHPTTSGRIKYPRSSSAGNLNPRKKERPKKRASTDDAKTTKRDTTLESPPNDNNRGGSKEQPKRKGILDAKISMFESMSPTATKKQRSPGESSIKSSLSASKGVEKPPATNKKTPPTSANTSVSTSATTEDTRSTLLQYLSDLPLESASGTQDFKPPSSNHQEVKDSLQSHHHHHHHASHSSPGSPKRRGIGYTDSLVQPEQLHDSSHSLGSTASSKRKKKAANDSQRPDFNDSSHSLGSATSSSSKRKKKGINLDSVPPELHDSSHSLGSMTSSSRRKNKGSNSTKGKSTSARNVADGAEQIVGLNDEIISPSTREKRRPKSSRRKSKSLDAAFDTFQSKPAAPLKKKKSPRQPTKMLDESEIKSASSPTEDSNRSLPVSPPLDTAPTTKADNNEEKLVQVSPEEWWELEKEKMSNKEEKADNNSNENPEKEISPEEWWKLETEKMIAGESKTKDATKIEDEGSPSGRKRSGNMSSRISKFETNKSGDGISTTLAVNGVLSPRNTHRKSKSMESTRLAPILSPRATKKSTETKIDADLSRTPKSKQRTSKSSREKSKRSEENAKGDVKPTEKEAASKRKSAGVPSNQSANEDKNSQPLTPTKPHSEEKAQNVGMTIKDRLAMFNKACASPPPPSDPARTRRGFLTPRLVKKKKALCPIDEQSTNEPPVENTGPKATSKEPEDDPRKRLKKTVSIEKTNSFNRKHLLNAASDVHDQRNRLKESRSRSGLQEFVPHRGDEFHKAITAKTDEDFTSFIPPQFAKSESEVQLIKTALEKNFIFEHLELDDIERLVAAFQPFEVPKGETIIKQGDDGDYFYVIASGEVTYHIINRKVGMAGKGKTFGEMALIYTCPRTASVKAASEPTSLFRVDQKTFRYVIRSPTRTSREEKEKLLRGVTFISQLGDADIERLCSVMTPLDFEAGDFIVQKGDEGDSFFVLKEGEAKVADFVMGNTRYEDVTLKAGDYFGEGALNSSEPRVADVVALTKGSAFSIDRATFQKVLGDFENLVSRAQDRKKLNGIKMFKELGLSSDDLDALVGLVVNKEFKANELICKEGHTFDAAMFFVRSGTVRISSHDGYRDEEIKAGGYFGVEHLLVDALSANKSERSLFEAFGTSESSSLIEASYTAMICSDGCTLGVLSLEDCRTVFDTTSINFGGVSSDLLSRRATIQKNIKKTLNLEDLNRDSILGEGQFGEVWRVTTVIDGEDSPQEFALKIQSTNDPIREDSALEAIHREMYILKKLNHPFIVGLVATYECNDYVYMLMEVVKGGELWSVIHVEDENGDWTSGISETDSKFYSFIVADTLAYMHRQKIVFRDLKPENVLIDHEGYPILVDFGFAKVIGGTTYTFCGTPNYLAPEIVMNSGHGFAADHWALGVIMYEMVCGENPFYYDDMDQITLFKSIVQDRMYPMPEEKASPDMVDIVERLLEKHPIQRLGSLADGSKGILKHKWFDQLDVNKVRNKEAKAPWLPPPK